MRFSLLSLAGSCLMACLLTASGWGVEDSEKVLRNQRSRSCRAARACPDADSHDHSGDLLPGMASALLSYAAIPGSAPAASPEPVFDARPDAWTAARLPAWQPPRCASVRETRIRDRAPPV